MAKWIQVLPFGPKKSNYLLDFFSIFTQKLNGIFWKIMIVKWLIGLLLRYAQLLRILFQNDVQFPSVANATKSKIILIISLKGNKIHHLWTHVKTTWRNTSEYIWNSCIYYSILKKKLDRKKCLERVRRRWFIMSWLRRSINIKITVLQFPHVSFHLFIQHE